MFFSTFTPDLSLNAYKGSSETKSTGAVWWAAQRSLQTEASKTLSGWSALYATARWNRVLDSETHLLTIKSLNCTMKTNPYRASSAFVHIALLSSATYSVILLKVTKSKQKTFQHWRSHWFSDWRWNLLLAHRGKSKKRKHRECF